MPHGAGSSFRERAPSGAAAPRRIPSSSSEGSCGLLDPPFTRGAPLSRSGSGSGSTILPLLATSEAVSGTDDDEAAPADGGGEVWTLPSDSTPADPSGGCTGGSRDGPATVLSVLPVLCLPADAAGEVSRLFENMVAQSAAAVTAAAALTAAGWSVDADRGPPGSPQAAVATGDSVEDDPMAGDAVTTGGPVGGPAAGDAITAGGYENPAAVAATADLAAGFEAEDISSLFLPGLDIHYSPPASLEPPG